MKKKILALSGSLRAGSFNTRLIEAMTEIGSEDFEITRFDLTSLPFFNEDVEKDYPKEAQALKDAIAAADGLIISTPEYNRSVPGVLKNAIDWASRPYGTNSFAGKTILVVGSTAGTLGTALAQYHLKQVLNYLDARVIGQPEFYLSNAYEKFDGAGVLTDEATREQIKKTLEVLKSRLS